jgi:hypothetical protein
MVRKNKEFFKIVRVSTLEELVYALNYYLSCGWFLEDQDVMRTEFFQEFTALLVSTDYLKYKKKYYSLFEGKEKQNFNISLHSEMLENKARYVKK